MGYYKLVTYRLLCTKETLKYDQRTIGVRQGSQDALIGRNKAVVDDVCQGPERHPPHECDGRGALQLLHALSCALALEWVTRLLVFRLASGAAESLVGRINTECRVLLPGSRSMAYSQPRFYASTLCGFFFSVNRHVCLRFRWPASLEMRFTIAFLRYTSLTKLQNTHV